MKKLLVIAVVAMFGFAFGCGGAALPDAPEVPEVPDADIETPELPDAEGVTDAVEGEIAPEEAEEAAE